MDTAPSTESVYQGVYTLYNNPDTVEQERASRWLEQLQNSVSISLWHFLHSEMYLVEIVVLVVFVDDHSLSHNHTFRHFTT